MINANKSIKHRNHKPTFIHNYFYKTFMLIKFLLQCLQEIKKLITK